MRPLSFKLVSWFFLIWFTISPYPVMAQDWGDNTNSASDEFGGDPFGGDPFGGMINEEKTDELLWDEPEPELQDPTPDVPSTSPKSASSPSYSEPSHSTYSSGSEHGTESNVQNAIIEGVQITTEKGNVEDEKIVSGYFIFRDKPTSYFYEVKLREKKLVFEFNDTRTGSSPVPSVSETPIKGFKIIQDKVDVNKDVRGLKPEWHDMIRVTFDLENVPEIHVNDEYSIISFSFKWSDNPDKLAQYIVKDKTPKVILWSSAAVGGVGLGVLAYFLISQPPPPAPLGPLPVDDLPNRGSNYRR